jgi:serine/threonine protein kinase
MAPEIALRPYDEKCDIWSFGITCIEIAEAKGPLEPFLNSKNSWSYNFQKFISRILNKKPESRPHAKTLLRVKSEIFFYELKFLFFKDKFITNKDLKEVGKRIRLQVKGKIMTNSISYTNS